MSPLMLSRRRFAGLLGVSVGGALASPAIATTTSLSTSSVPAVNDATAMVHLDFNESPYGPSAAARDAIARSQDVFSRYPVELEEQLIATIARGHGVPPAQVILGCGSGEILQMADRVFLSAGQKVVAAEPTFEAVLDFAGVMQANGLKVPLDAAFRHDLPRMAAACDKATGLVYVCNPNNPTATVVSGAALEEFMRRVPPTTMVLVDEAYHHFVEDPGYRSATELLPRHANLIVVRTFSKIYGMAGLRLGYAIGAEPVIARLRRHAVASNTNTAVLAAALASLNDELLVKRMRNEFNTTKRRLYAELDKQKRPYIPSETNFVMIHMGQDVGPLIAAFRQRQIRVGRRFAAMPEYLRISIGMPKEMDLFATTLREVAPPA